MSDLKLPKHRIIEKAKAFHSAGEKASSKKLGTLMTLIHEDPTYWLWVNETLFESFTWATEAMAAKLNRGEVIALSKHLERNDLHLVHFDDTKAYQAIIIEAIETTILSLKKTLSTRLIKLEEDTACVLKFTKDGAIATGYPHGIPLTAYFTSKGIMFVVYVDKYGSNKVYDSSSALPLDEEHIVRRVSVAIEKNSVGFDDACKLNLLLTTSQVRLENLEKFGMTALQ